MCALKSRNLAHGQLKSRFLANIMENAQYQDFWQNQMKRALRNKGGDWRRNILNRETIHFQLVNELLIFTACLSKNLLENKFAMHQTFTLSTLRIPEEDCCVTLPPLEFK